MSLLQEMVNKRIEEKKKRAAAIKITRACVVCGSKACGGWDCDESDYFNEL